MAAHPLSVTSTLGGLVPSAEIVSESTLQSASCCSAASEDPTCWTNVRYGSDSPMTMSWAYGAASPVTVSLPSAAARSRPTQSANASVTIFADASDPEM